MLRHAHASCCPCAPPSPTALLPLLPLSSLSSPPLSTMSKHTGQKDTALRNVEEQLQRLLSPPLFIIHSFPHLYAGGQRNPLARQSVYRDRAPRTSPSRRLVCRSPHRRASAARTRRASEALSREHHGERARSRVYEDNSRSDGGEWDTAFLPLQEARAIIKKWRRSARSWGSQSSMLT